jgi:hypothetical protein
MRSVMERADRNMVSDVVEALQARLQRRRWSDGSLCGISQKDGFACAFMDGAVIAPERRHEAARAIGPTHNARKEVEKWETQ